MRIHRIRIESFKGVDVELPWASALVFFGANDSGKTNILEAVLSHCGSERTVRTMPGASRPGGYLEFDVELDGLDIPGHQDREVLLTWLLDIGVKSNWVRDPWSDDLVETAIDSGEAVEWWSAASADFARLRSDADRANALDELFERVRDHAREALQFQVGLTDHPPEDPWVAAGDMAVASRMFTVGDDLLGWWPPGVDTNSEAGLLTLTMYFGRGAQRGMDSFLDVLGLQVIRVDAARNAQRALYDRLEHILCEKSYGWHAPEDMQEFIRTFTARKRSPWVERSAEGTISLQPGMQEACRELSACVSRLTPPFVSGSYDIRIVPLLPDQWEVSGGRHVAVELCVRGQDLSFDLELASQGVATWAGFALSEALRLWEEDLDHSGLEAPFSAGAGPTIYVFDEPEAHLHPLAQEQAADWIAERVRAGANVLLATHAVPFLRLPLADVEYFKVTRTAAWTTKAEVITQDVLGAVAASAGSLGVPPVALIQLTRAWLVVEGEHDRMILEAFHGQELRRAGIQMLPLRGAGRAKASFLNLAALAPLGAPFFCLLDNTRTEAVRSGAIDKSNRTEEEVIAEQLWRLGQKGGVELEVLGLPYPDVICALPMEAVRCLARENGGKPDAALSWDELIDRHDRHTAEAALRGKKAANFKAFTLELLGLNNWSPDRLVEEALRLLEGQTPPKGPLSRIVSEIVASTDNRPTDAE